MQLIFYTLLKRNELCKIYEFKKTSINCDIMTIELFFCIIFVEKRKVLKS